MTASRTVPDDLDERFAAAWAELETERRRTVDERDAFDAFADRVAAVSATPVPAEPTAAGSYAVRRPALVAVRRAYEETVMSVPHYREEYDDTYSQSVAAEFGPELATALVRGERFHPHHKRALVTKARRARDNRDAFVETIDEERASLRAAAAELEPLSEEVDSLGRTDRGAASFGELDAYLSRLDVLEGKLEDVAADRQRTIRERRSELRLPTEEGNVQPYLYRNLDVAYPVLWSVARLREAVEDRRRRIERAIATAD